METYIVRIYRNSGSQLAGTLEAVEYGRQLPFHDLAGLMMAMEQATGYGGVGGTIDRAESSVHRVEVPRVEVPRHVVS